MIDTRFYNMKDGGLTIADLCSRLDLPVPDGSFADETIFRPAALAGSEVGEVAFLEGKRHIDALQSAKATACFVRPKFAPAVAERHIVPIECAAPKYELARATDFLISVAGTNAPDIPASCSVHPTAHIGSGVKLGERVVVGPNTVIENAVIGDDVSIGACTVIGGAGFGVVVGPNGEHRSVPHVGRVVIGDRVRIGSNTCIDRGQLGDTVIGDECQIDNLVQIAHNVVLERRCILAGRVGISGSCYIGEGVQMGGSAGLADHVTIGDGARLAAFAGVMHDVPAGETWSGIPAMPIRDHMRVVANAKRALRK